MANVVLPQVSILNSLANDANLLVEQNGEINRFAVTDLDIGGGDVTVDLAGGLASIPTGINADSLGGYPAEDYVRNRDQALTVDLTDVREGVVALSNADMLGGVAANDYAKLSDLNGLQMELLWENASPDSEFAAQTLSIENGPYDMFIVTARKNTTSKDYPNTITFKNKSGKINGFSEYLQYRSLTITDNTFNFSDAVRYTTYGSSSSSSKDNDNSNVIPIYIFGIKGVAL